MQVPAAWIVFIAGVHAFAAPPDTPARTEPVMVSMHPFTVQRGTATAIALRGSGLRGASKAVISAKGVTISSVGTPVPAPTKGGRGNASEVVSLRVEVEPGVKPGKYPIRLITANGISNALPLYITDQPINEEPTGTHDTPQTAIAISSVPAVFTGRIAERGETDYYRFHAKAGETITFNVISGLPQTAAGGSAATIANFDPSLTIYEQSGSWLDPQRMKRIVYNDEPVFVFGKSTDVHIAHHFAKEGDYWMRVEAFAGQGGPNYSYQLRVLPGEVPEEGGGAGDDGRGYGRKLSADRLNQLAARGGAKADKPSAETYRADAQQVPSIKLPATVEGALLQPGEAHHARFEVDGPKDIAVEIETPDSAPPFFNPLVRLLNTAGDEVATNVSVGKGACSGAMTKSLQAKVLVPIREAGSYTLEVRDATADHAGPTFRYRVQIRPQVPHLGQVKIDADHINLAPGEAKTIRVTFDREEDYRGAVAVMAESLPPGVQVLTGADYEPDKDPPLRIGNRERFTPRTERTVVVFTAASDAAASAEPQSVRLVVRPVANGKLGDPVGTKTIPMMVLAK